MLPKMTKGGWQRMSTVYGEDVFLKDISEVLTDAFNEGVYIGKGEHPSYYLEDVNIEDFMDSAAYSEMIGKYINKPWSLELSEELEKDITALLMDIWENNLSDMFRDKSFSEYDFELLIESNLEKLDDYLFEDEEHYV